jgi:hypothetical protein
VRRARRRYLARSPGGAEMVCPSLADLHALYVQGFLEDHDLVKAEGERDWTPAGSYPPLHGVRESRRDLRRVAALLGAAIALALALWVLRGR